MIKIIFLLSCILMNGSYGQEEKSIKSVETKKIEDGLEKKQIEMIKIIAQEHLYQDEIKTSAN